MDKVSKNMMIGIIAAIVVVLVIVVMMTRKKKTSKELPLSDIHFIPSEYTDHLYHSIIRIGFSFPIKVKETGCGYLCVDGNKRLTALRDILEKDPSYKRGDKVKVIIVNSTDNRFNDCSRGRNTH